MKKLCLILFSSVLLYATTTEFLLNDTTKAKLIIQNRTISVSIDGKKQDLQQQTSQNITFNIKDLNFDGYKDIAISSGDVGYGGVNNYKDYFFYDPSQKLFYLAGKHINNLQLQNKQLVSYTKDGPFLYESIYDIQNKKLYKLSTSVDFGLLKQTTLFDTKGNQISKMFTPSTLKITTQKAYFYKQADESTKTKIYIIKNDTVKVLDYDPFGGWIKIEYQSPKKTFVAWIKEDTVKEI